jgi:hypothetical protein
MTKPKQKISTEQPDALFGRVVSILDQAQGNVVRAVNSNMVLAYWSIGREIVQELQGGEERAAYGTKVIEDLSTRLTQRYGRGFSSPVLWSFRQFYLAYADRATILFLPGRESSASGNLSPAGRELPLLQKSDPAGSESVQGFSPQLSWSHYRALMRVDTIGLLLCSDKSKAVAKYSILSESKQIFASKYMLCLPTEDQLRLEIERERHLIESALEYRADA